MAGKEQKEPKGILQDPRNSGVLKNIVEIGLQNMTEPEQGVNARDLAPFHSLASKAAEKLAMVN